MSDQLQGLLDRIYNDGIKKSESAKDSMLAEARSEADAIISQAKKEAESIVAKAQDEARKNEDRAKASIQQASRDILIALEENILKRLRVCVKSSVESAMTPQFMVEIVKRMAGSCNAQSGEKKDLSLIFSAKEVDIMADAFRTSLASSFGSQPEILRSAEFGSGVKIGFKGQDVYLDFSDATLADIICGYVGPRLAEIIRENK